MRDHQLNWAMKAVPERYKKSHIISIANVPRSCSLLFGLLLALPLSSLPLLVISLPRGIRLARPSSAVEKCPHAGVSSHPNERIH